MGSREGAPKFLEMSKNKHTRQDMINLINGAGLNLAAMCKKEGENPAQPSKKFLEYVVEKFSLAMPQASKKAEGIGKYISKNTQDRDMQEGGPSNNAVADSMEGFQHIGAKDDSDEEIALNQEGSNVIIQNNEDEMLGECPISPYYSKWYADLIANGYGNSRIRPPNKAVQLVLGCVLDMDMHKYMQKREAFLNEEEISVITFLGINNMIELVLNLNKVDDDKIAGMKIIDEVYRMLPEAHAEADTKEIQDVIKFVKCTSALELANEFKLTHPRRKAKSSKKQAPKSMDEEREKEPVPLVNCLFDVRKLPTEQQQALLKGKDCSKKPVKEIEVEEEVFDVLEEYNIKELTLTNCSTCPIISARLVELHGIKYNHALWDTKNLGVLAPISMETWRKLCNITDAELEQAHKDAINFTRRIGKVQVNMPFKNTQFFGKKCTKNNGIFLGQKGHMAKTSEKREPFYLVKIWRTYCPFFKCKCDKFGKGENGECNDHITWYDHAIWYMMNSMDRMWPDDNSTSRFLQFHQLMNSKHIRSGAIVFLGYLKVRETMLNMVTKYAEDKYVDFKAEFGNSKLVDIIEKTIKPYEFLEEATQKEIGNTASTGRYKRKTPKVDEEEIEVILPPKHYGKRGSFGATTGSTSADKDSVVILNDGGDTGHSVNKTEGFHKRTDGLMQNKIMF